MSKAHQVSLDSFFKSNETTAKRRNSDTDSDSTQENDDNVREGSLLKKAKKHRLFNRKYDQEYLKYGFVSSGDENSPKPLCVICGVTLSNDAMKPSKLLRHLNSAHPAYKDKPIDFFKRKRDEIKDQQKQMLKTTKVNVSALRASCLTPFAGPPPPYSASAPGPSWVSAGPPQGKRQNRSRPVSSSQQPRSGRHSHNRQSDMEMKSNPHRVNQL